MSGVTVQTGSIVLTVCCWWTHQLMLAYFQILDDQNTAFTPVYTRRADYCCTRPPSCARPITPVYAKEKTLTPSRLRGGKTCNTQHRTG